MAAGTTTLSVGGVSIRCQQAGRPTARQGTVVLLHGFPDSLELWAAQVPALVEAGFHVIALDLPGYGESSVLQEQHEYKLPNLSRITAAALDALGVDRFHLVGHDWGGFLGWEMAQRLPQRVQSFVALSVGHPGGFFTEGGNAQRSLSWYMLFFQHPEAEALLARDDWRLLRSFLAPNVGPKQVQAYVEALARPGRLTAGLGWYRANFGIEGFGATSINPEQLAARAQLSLPVMTVWSDQDWALTEAQARASERVVAPGKFRYEQVAGVGHWLPRDGPQQLNALLLDFLKPKASL